MEKSWQKSSANKYKFVWKKAVTKRLGKMMEEIPAFFLETETSFGICIRHGNELHKRHLKKLYRKLMKLKKESNTVDSYLCANGKQVKCEGTKKRKSRSGYVIENTVYACHDCTGCPYKKDCIRGNNSKQPLEQREKHFEVSKRLLELRAEDKERITSEEGKLLRMNRSIQAEGAFADVKEPQLFRRFLGTGHLNALTETVICALAHNFNKLHHKIQNGTQGRYLFPLQKLA